MPRDPRSRKGPTCHKETGGERSPGTSHLYPQLSRPQASPGLTNQITAHALGIWPLHRQPYSSILEMCIIEGTEQAFPVSGTKDKLINAARSTRGQIKEKWIWAVTGKSDHLRHATSSPTTEGLQD